MMGSDNGNDSLSPARTKKGGPPCQDGSFEERSRSSLARVQKTRYWRANSSRNCLPTSADENGFCPVTRLRSTTT